MTQRLLILYLLIVFVPLAVTAAAFALRDHFSRRVPDPSEGDGRADAEALEQTVEEVQAI